MFMMDMGSNRNNTSGNSWFYGNSSGEYFNFTTDTPGTVYMIGYITNSEFEADGWQSIASGKVASAPSPYSSFAEMDKSYNAWGDDSYTFVRYQWSTAAARFTEEALGATPTTTPYYEMQPGYVIYKKHFDAEEKVSIYHVGPQNPLMTAVIVWDTEGSNNED
jgi:hypothetical protein